MQCIPSPVLLPECDSAGLQGGVQGAVSLPRLSPSWIAQLRVCVPGCAMKGLVCDWAAPKSKLGSLPCTVCSTHVLLVKVPEELFPPNSSLYRKKVSPLILAVGKQRECWWLFFFLSWVNRASWIKMKTAIHQKNIERIIFLSSVLLFQTLQQQPVRLDWVLFRERKDWVSERVSYMQLKEYGFLRFFFPVHMSCFCAWYPGMKEGSWPMLSLCMCLCAMFLKEFWKKTRVPGIVNLHSPFACHMVLCDPSSITCGIGKEDNKGWAISPTAVLQVKGLQSC